MKLFKTVFILLLLFLVTIILVPVVSAASDKISPEKYENDANFVSVKKATSVANIFVKEISDVPGFSDWGGAKTKKVTTYYDLNGGISAYSFDVLINGQYVGYLIVSATRQNYPVLEFAKGKTPDREITTQSEARDVALNDAKSRQETLGEGRPLYLGPTFYYMQYPVEETGTSKGVTQTGEDMILVDLHENKIVNQRSSTSSDTRMMTTGDLVSLGLDEKSIAESQVLKEQDVKKSWALFDNPDSTRTQPGTSAKSQRSDNYTIAYASAMEVLDSKPGHTGGCGPTAVAMILTYYRDVWNCNRFSLDGDKLKSDLHDAMGTNSAGFTNQFGIVDGTNFYTLQNGYGFSAQTTLFHRYYAQKKQIDADQPYALFMIGYHDGDRDVDHVVAAYGYRRSSRVDNYIIVNDGWGHGEVFIHDGGWIYAAAINVEPDYLHVKVKSNSNGVITPSSQTLIKGSDSLPFTITANPGYVIESIKVNDGTVIDFGAGKTSYSYTAYNVKGNLVISVKFKKITYYTITPSAGVGGSISPSTALSVPEGGSQTFTISPDSGYVIDEVIVDGSSVGTVNSYTFNDLQASHSISALFKEQTLPAIVPLCPAGTAFDATEYPQNHPQSDPMTFECNWDGNGQVYISGEPDVLNGVWADDGFTVLVQPSGEIFDATPHYACQHSILELTSGMTPGLNSFTVIVKNWCGLSMSYGSSTGIGTDQTPYIIEVNSPDRISEAEFAKVAEMPSFIIQTEKSLMVNGTSVSGKS